MHPRVTLPEHAASLDDRPLAADVDLARFGTYRGYSELVTAWQGLAGRGIAPRAIGTSVAGTPLFAFVVGPEDAPYASVVLAGLHPLEWIGVETAHALLDRLAGDPPRERRVVVIPLINVDGYRRVEADLRGARRRWRRGNTNRVDLNRNWPAFFTGRRLPWPLARWRPHGTRPLSEPETAAVCDVLDEIARSAVIDRAVSLHSFGRMILVPYGGTRRRPRQADRLEEAARAVKDRLAEPYRVLQCSRWWPGRFARGIEIDHLHEHYQAVALLIECSRGGLRPGDPRTWIEPFCWYNPRDRDRVTAEIAAALEPFVRGAPVRALS